MLDASRCKLVLVCDNKPVAKLNLADGTLKQVKPRQRRVKLAPEEYLPPSVLKQHMRPVSDILQAQHYAASHAADLTNQCITITTVCKELVC